MKWSTPWRVLVGDRAAILEAASTRWTLLVGFILVLSASLARKYDTVDLLAEPHELLHGVAAAMVNAFGIHLLFWALGSESPRPPFWRSYLSFLGVFMLAAPMGWVYGVPYEQFLSAPSAVAANMWSLAAVSVVRVVWMTRVLNVLWEIGEDRRLGTFFAMMIYCDAVAIVALLTAPVPTLDVMGGLQQPEEIRIVAEAALLAGAFAVLSSPLWLLVGSIALFGNTRRWRIPETRERKPMPRFAIGVATAVVFAWASLLPSMQVQPRNRTRFESLLAEGRMRDGIRMLIERQRADFPPVWNAPPRFEVGEREERSRLPAIAEAIRAEGASPGWVDELYGRKMVRWCTIKLLRYWGTVIGPKRPDHEWSPPSDEARENAWSGLEKQERAEVRVCLEFIRDRLVTLTGAERGEVMEWIESGERWEAGPAEKWDQERARSRGGE